MTNRFRGTWRLPPGADQRIDYGNVISDPLEADVVGGKSADEALAAIGDAAGGSTPTATLRMVSSPDEVAGMSARARPYWVVTWPMEPRPIRRLSHRVGRQTVSREEIASVALGVTFVDALTGTICDFISHLQEARDKPGPADAADDQRPAR